MTNRMMKTGPRRRSPKLLVPMILFAAALASIASSCTDDSKYETTRGADTTQARVSADDTKSRPAVVVSTSWVAAFVKAAGIDDVTIVAPVDRQHPADYDPRPSDLAAVAKADYVLLGGFEAFAERMTEAAGSKAEVVKVNLNNAPDDLRKEVRKLAEMFGTTDAADTWISRFDEQISELRTRIDEARPTPAPSVVSHAFMTSWADFAGVDLVGTFGPEPVSAQQLAEFSTAAPDMVFDNTHVPVGSALDDLDAVKVGLINFPPASLDLIDVFKANTKAIIEGFAKL